MAPPFRLSLSAGFLALVLAGFAPPAPGQTPAPVVSSEVAAPLAPAAGDRAAPLPGDPAPEATPLAEARTRIAAVLQSGGPAMGAIAALSVATLALILWKLWRLALAGVWSQASAQRAVGLWQAGRRDQAIALVAGRRAVLARMAAAAMRARLDLAEAAAREEAARAARQLLAAQTGGLRALELIATIAPLLGLLGTVLGMIAAFQALQQAGHRTDPALLAGGIWEALLTTAAGMAVAIPASVALVWFEAVVERLRAEMEDLATRIFVDRPASAARPVDHVGLAAE